MDEVPAELPPPTAEGTFARTPFVQVLVYVLERSLTGTIEIIHPAGPWASVLVLDGQPSKGRTSEPVAYLGSVLHELGYIDDLTLNSSLAAMAKERKLHGQILLARGKITEAQLRDGLRAQLVRKIEHIFDWPPETRFAYYDGFDGLHTYGADDHVHLDPVPIVWAAVRTHPPWEHVHAALTRVGSNGLRITPSAQLERFELSKEERAAAELLRFAPMRVHELVATKLLSASTMQLLAYCLLITKQVELVASLRAEPSQIKVETPASIARVQLAQAPPPPRVASNVAAEERAQPMRADPRAGSSPSLAPPARAPRPAPGPGADAAGDDAACRHGRRIAPALRAADPRPAARAAESGHSRARAVDQEPGLLPDARRRERRDDRADPACVPRPREDVAPGPPARGARRHPRRVRQGLCPDERGAPDAHRSEAARAVHAPPQGRRRDPRRAGASPGRPRGGDELPEGGVLPPPRRHEGSRSALPQSLRSRSEARRVRRDARLARGAEGREPGAEADRRTNRDARRRDRRERAPRARVLLPRHALQAARKPARRRARLPPGRGPQPAQPRRRPRSPSLRDAPEPRLDPAAARPRTSGARPPGQGSQSQRPPASSKGDGLFGKLFKK